MLLCVSEKGKKWPLGSIDNDGVEDARRADYLNMVRSWQQSGRLLAMLALISDTTEVFGSLANIYFSLEKYWEYATSPLAKSFLLYKPKVTGNLNGLYVATPHQLSS